MKIISVLAEADLPSGPIIGPLILAGLTAALGIKGLTGTIPWTREKNISGWPARILGIICMGIALLFALGAFQNL
jgi:hypothetical protein